MGIYQKIPIHFGADVWSPPAAWDHDFGWSSPKQKLVKGPLMIKYYRWGTLPKYHDVMVSITYTFYAYTPYIEVNTMMEFTKNRSARAVRLGEIVTTSMAAPNHWHSLASNIKPADVAFTHFAWLNSSGKLTELEIQKHLDKKNAAQIKGLAYGCLGVLQRDVPFVAGYHQENKQGIASLRKSHFVINKLGNPLPFTAACTYLANYGWGFSYFSRPFVYPFGMVKTNLDQNNIVATGTVFGTTEALLIFDPSHNLQELLLANKKFQHPLKLQFKGTGPW